MATIYIETSIVSYLRQKPSAHVVTAARQLLTYQWWDKERPNYSLVVSQYVIDEASAGNPTLAADRLALLDGIPLLPLSSEIRTLAEEILSNVGLPSSAQIDALHIAAAAHHRIQYLLTWNCKHIANAKLLPALHEVLNRMGIPIPLICTPEELLGDG